MPASTALSCDEAGQNIILNLAMEAIRDDSQHAAATLHIDDRPYHLDLKVMKQCASLAEVLGLCLKDANNNNLGLKAAQNIPLPVARPVLNRIASIGLVVNGGAGKIIHDKVLYGKE